MASRISHKENVWRRGRFLAILNSNEKNREGNETDLQPKFIRCGTALVKVVFSGNVFGRIVLWYIFLTRGARRRCPTTTTFWDIMKYDFHALEECCDTNTHTHSQCFVGSGDSRYGNVMVCDLKCTYPQLIIVRFFIHIPCSLFVYIRSASFVVTLLLRRIIRNASSHPTITSAESTEYRNIGAWFLPL